MRVNHIRGQAGSGKSTTLHAIFKMQGSKNSLLVGGATTTAGILQALDRHQNVTTLLIDDFNPRKINLKKLAQHERAPRLVVHVAHISGGAA